MVTTLLVEDNEMFREVLKETLLDHFPEITVHEAADGSEAMTVIRTCCPELIFMDISLAGESGLELTKKIKADYPLIEIVVLTAHDVSEFEHAALSAGASLLLVKTTFLEKDLVEIVQKRITSKNG